MAAVKISDIIVPEVFNGYVIEKTAEKSALISSGIVKASAELNSLAVKGGKLITMPQYDDLTGADEVLSDSGSLTAGKITTDQDVAVLHMRGRAWGSNDLAEAVNVEQSDPMDAIASLVGEYWARRMQSLLLSTLVGVFTASGSSMDSLISDITGNSGDAAVISDQTFVDAMQVMGDAKDKLSGVLMHSATEAKLVKDGLAQQVFNPATGEAAYTTFLGKRVIIDDTSPVSGTSYTTYIFGEGAIGLGNGQPPVPTEVDRDSLAGEDYLINRKHFILHPRGVEFTSGSVAGSSPTNAECEDGANNWTRVWQVKNIRIVKFVHKLA